MNAMLGAMTRVDRWLLVALLERRRPRLDHVMRKVTRLGNAELCVPPTLLVALGAIPELAASGRLALFALVTSHLAVQLLKLGVRRERPELPVGLGFLIEPEDRFSFPSGHAAAGLSVAVPLFLALAGVFAWAVLAVGLCVGLSRCYLGVHYPGDVGVGWGLAVGAVAFGGLLGLGL